LHHFDLYRTLEDKEIAESIKDLASDDENIVVVEWPENISDILPVDYLAIEFKYIDEDTRELGLSAHGERSTALLEAL